MRGAVISFLALFSFASTSQSRPLKLPGSAIVVTPCAIHNLNTYSALGAWLPPVCACVSTNPGIRYIPSAFNSFPPSFNFGLRAGFTGAPGAPTLAICTIRFPSTTISTGPTGGESVPLIRVTPRMINCDQGPSPSCLDGAFCTCANKLVSGSRKNSKKQHLKNGLCVIIVV